MPITYSIDLDRRLIFERWTGDVSGADLARYWRDYLADPQVMAIRRTIVDLRESNPTFTGMELSSLIHTVVFNALEGRDWTTALVVAKPLQFGVSRQYQVFAECYSRDAIFEDPDLALEWIQNLARSPQSDPTVDPER